MEEDKIQYTKFLQGDNKALEELIKKISKPSYLFYYKICKE